MLLQMVGLYDAVYTTTVHGMLSGPRSLRSKQMASWGLVKVISIL